MLDAKKEKAYTQRILNAGSTFKASEINSKGKEYHHQVLPFLVRELFTTAKQADLGPGERIITALLMAHPYHLMTTVR